MDSDGYLFVLGHDEDTMIRGSENIAPGEVSETLRAHPAVRDAALVGEPDDEWSQVIVAVVVTSGHEDAEELRRWVRSCLRRSKAPDRILFRDTVPYSESSKLIGRDVVADLLAIAYEDGGMREPARRQATEAKR